MISQRSRARDRGIDHFMVRSRKEYELSC